MFAFFSYRLYFKSFALTKTTHFLFYGAHSFIVVHKLHGKRLFVSVQIRLWWFTNYIANFCLFLVAHYELMKKSGITNPCTFRVATRNFEEQGSPKVLGKVSQRYVFVEMMVNPLN